jgi:hypothetical protein
VQRCVAFLPFVLPGLRRIKRQRQSISSKIAIKIVMLKMNERKPDPARHGRASMRRQAGKIMLQKRSREIAAQNRQPKNGKAARQLNSSRATRRENGSIMARRRSIENRLLRVVHTGLHQMPTINFGVKIRPDCASISKVSLLGWIAATGHTS